ncbi:MAG: PIN domain-containing protein [Candidatus Aminicenantales bacterium]
MKTRNVLDAYALLAYLEGEGGAVHVSELMDGASELLMNAINVGEVFYIAARTRGLGAAEHFLNVILPSLPITVLDNSFEDVIEAARLKAAHAVSLADCFAAATAIRERGTLVTGDREFEKFGRTLEINWI